MFLVGSYNLDPRSQDLNTEVMCLGENEEVARELLASIETHLANSWSVGRDGPPSASEHYPGVSRAKSFRAWAARFLMLPFVEKQL
jgi:phosphatidylserine/phosphatidylglycerophosphate/cardiolipin synthase-like enzyme